MVLRLWQSQYKKEPFILASQEKQVFYSRDNNSSSWHVLQKEPPRGYYELEMYDEKEDTTSMLENMLDENIEDDMKELVIGGLTMRTF
ncbi:hypothetical protein WN943_025337 [Citrus x changshan-huyou]